MQTESKAEGVESEPDLDLCEVIATDVTRGGAGCLAELFFIPTFCGG